MIDKKELRIQIKQLKKQFSDGDKKERSLKILSQLEENPFFKSAATILIYWSMHDEVHTHEFINKWFALKTVLLPSVHGDQLKIRQYTGEDSLKPGELMGILEPTGPEYPTTKVIDLIVVPGVAFDKRNYRIGRGRGFYDRLLQSHSAKKVGICFDFQLFDSIPVESHDIPMDLVIWS